MNSWRWNTTNWRQRRQRRAPASTNWCECTPVLPSLLQAQPMSNMHCYPSTNSSPMISLLPLKWNVTVREHYKENISLYNLNCQNYWSSVLCSGATEFQGVLSMRRKDSWKWFSVYFWGGLQDVFMICCYSITHAISPKKWWLEKRCMDCSE